MEKFEKLPKHIAIIMDGNGRWAQKRSLERLEGHRQGAENVREIVKACSEWGVNFLTLYAFSTENWNRPSEEVSGLMDIFKVYIKQELPELHANQVKMNFIGDLERLPLDVRKVIKESQDFTKKNSGVTLTLALSYGGRNELLYAVRRIAQRVQEGSIELDDIDDQLFSSFLYSHDLPDPDLLIRTSGEFRISNFLLWQIAYSEIYVTDILWPDFNKAALAQAIKDYGKRMRRFGKTSEQIRTF